MRFTLYLSIGLMSLLSACISYDAETEQKFQENYAFMQSYQEELGLKNSPFVEIPLKENLDKQRKKQFALMSKEEIKALLDAKGADIPKLESGTARSNAYFKEIEDLNNPRKAYEILHEKYPDIIIK